MQFQGKIMNQMRENGKTPNFGAEIWAPKFFLWILPVLYVRHCYKLSLYATSRKNNQPILTKWQKKPSFRPDFGLSDPNLGHQYIFLKTSGFLSY